MFVLKMIVLRFSACKGKHFHKTTKQKERKISKNMEKSYFFVILQIKKVTFSPFLMIFDINQLKVSSRR